MEEIVNMLISTPLQSKAHVIFHSICRFPPRLQGCDGIIVSINIIVTLS